MNIKFVNAPDEIKLGLEEIIPHLNLNISDDGYICSVEKKNDSDISVTFDGQNVHIVYSEKHHFFRALGLAIQHIKEGEKNFNIIEKAYFRSNGPMFDLSQAASAFNVKELKSIIRQLALMGLNMLMLYTEDNYEVENQPYFGYMRPKYSQDDLKELDDYAYNLGIEMIPCIQTLSHMQEALKWKVYRGITDYPACVLVGEEKTYEFLKDIISAASKPFRTKKIHIGMDEANDLGRVNFLTKFGYKSNGEIMRMHLERVMKIVNELGLKPMMWDDMFFSTFGTKKYRQKGATVPEETKKLVPEGMTCVYWEYTGEGAELYDDYFRQHFELDPNFVFAGGIQSWMSYAFSWTKTKRTAIDALSACKRHGVKDVFVTTWADHNAECLINANLIGVQLYAELGYSESYDEEKFAKRFKFCTGGNLEDFKLLEYLDVIPQTENLENRQYYNTSKHLMWQDVLTGLVDNNYTGFDLNNHYAALAEKLKKAIGNNGQFDGLFEMSYLAAYVLAIKSEIGIKLVESYKAGDKAALKHFADVDLPELKNRVELLQKSHMQNWFEIYKPLGWDVCDIRYGALISRVNTAIYEINEYLEGRMERLEELEQPRLPFDGIEGPIRYMNRWERLATPSKLAANISINSY
ncbi:MAG: beta-N-acetylhexosaminidase [Clostridia bacterium]|nr:beta-N-acetylhexosaminidase [Clostridia bacterium]